MVVLDNLREGVLTPDIYDPTLNPLYRDVLKHYGAVALPCRVRDPDRKGKVESGVGHAQKDAAERVSASRAWKKRRRIWITGKSAGPTRGIHGTTKRQVAAMFAEETSGAAAVCRWNLSAITNTASAPCIWTAASKSRPHTMARLRAGSDAAFRCSGMTRMCG